MSIVINKIYTLCLPSTVKKQKLKSGKIRVISTMYITSNNYAPAFFVPQNIVKARNILNALKLFKRMFPKSKGWHHGEFKKFVNDDSAYWTVSFTRNPNESDKERSIKALNTQYV